MEHVLDEIAAPLDFLRFLSLAKMHAFAVTGPLRRVDGSPGCPRLKYCQNVFSFLFHHYFDVIATY